MPRVGFEHTIPAGEWPKTYALDRAATGTGINFHVGFKKSIMRSYKLLKTRYTERISTTK